MGYYNCRYSFLKGEAWEDSKRRGMGNMRLITERRNVQDRVIDYLQAIGWEYIPPADPQEKRGLILKILSSLKF